MQWDGETKSIYIGQSTAHNTYLLDVCPPYQVNGFTDGKTDGTEIFTMAGKSYTNGLVAAFRTDITEFVFNLDGKYNDLGFLFGHIDGSDGSNVTINVYLDGKLADELEFSSELLPKNFNVKLNGALQMKLVVKSDKSNYNNFSYAPKYGFAEMVVK